VSVIIAAHNEEERVAARLRNCLAQGYPSHLEIIVASDGSTDRTVEIAREYEGVVVLDFPQNRGRAAVQNDAAASARGEIVVFTDAETEFEPDFLARIAAAFADPRVGCAVGNLVYREKDTAVGVSEGMYWRFEKKLRQVESDLGILATATGACMAVRRSLWRPLTPIDDSDFTTPLDVILQGYRVVYVPEAVAYDVPASSMRGEFRTRVRQTSKNLIGTLRRWGLRNWFTHPAVSWGLLSHKILRWMTPFFMAGALAANRFLLDDPFYRLTLALQAVFYLLGIVGFVADAFGRRVPLASFVAGFCVACLGMGVGVIKGLFGRAPAAYRAAERRG
jgi:cellulose synthase/poly-beta-1,6-N-acetylglucosamine synthase-like glycosyltransferase